MDQHRIDAETMKNYGLQNPGNNFMSTGGGMPKIGNMSREPPRQVDMNSAFSTVSYNGVINSEPSVQPIQQLQNSKSNMHSSGNVEDLRDRLLRDKKTISVCWSFNGVNPSKTDCVKELDIAKLFDVEKIEFLVSSITPKCACNSLTGKVALIHCSDTLDTQNFISSNGIFKKAFCVIPPNVEAMHIKGGNTNNSQISLTDSQVDNLLKFSTKNKEGVLIKPFEAISTKYDQYISQNPMPAFAPASGRAYVEMLIEIAMSVNHSDIETMMDCCNNPRTYGAQKQPIIIIAPTDSMFDRFISAYPLNKEEPRLFKDLVLQRSTEDLISIDCEECLFIINLIKTIKNSGPSTRSLSFTLELDGKDANGAPVGFTGLPSMEKSKETAKANIVMIHLSIEIEKIIKM
jgi:hypothetical protein